MRAPLDRLGDNERARISYTDVIMGFATLVALVTVAPWIYRLVDMGQGPLGALSSVLLALIFPLLVVALLISVGVSART